MKTHSQIQIKIKEAEALWQKAVDEGKQKIADPSSTIQDCLNVRYETDAIYYQLKALWWVME